MSRPQIVHEELAQLRNTRQILFFLAQTLERRDRDLVAALERVVEGQRGLTALLELRMEQVCRLLEQASEASEQLWLESHGCVVQANEVIRNLREEVRKSPDLVANLVSLQVGARLDAQGEAHPVEVGVGSVRRRTREVG